MEWGVWFNRNDMGLVEGNDEYEKYVWNQFRMYTKFAKEVCVGKEQDEGPRLWSYF